jgi:hypothetical protein
LLTNLRGFAELSLNIQYKHIKHIVRAFWPLPDAALTHLEELIVRFCRNQDTQPFIIVDMVFPMQTTEEYNK